MINLDYSGRYSPQSQEMVNKSTVATLEKPALIPPPEHAANTPIIRQLSSAWVGCVGSDPPSRTYAVSGLRHVTAHRVHVSSAEPH